MAASRFNLTLARFPIGKPSVKSFTVKDGMMVKTSPTFPSMMQAKGSELSLQEFANLATAGHRDLIAVHSAAVVPGAFYIASSRVLESARNKWGSRAFRWGSGVGTGIHRPLRAPGILLVDVDTKGIPADDVLKALIEVCPAIAAAPVLLLPSASGFVALAGERVESGGWHILVGIADMSDTERAGTVLHQRLVLAGHGFPTILDAGDVTVRSFVDLAALREHQPHFFCAPDIGRGIVRKVPDPQILNSLAIPLDTAEWLEDLDAEEEMCFRAIERALIDSVAEKAFKIRGAYIDRRAAAEVSRGAFATVGDAMASLRQVFRDDGILPADHQLHFDGLGWTAVAAVLESPETFREMTLADPVEPFYGAARPGVPARNKAVLRVLVNGGIAVYSRAHYGRRYWLRQPRSSVEAQLEGAVHPNADDDRELDPPRTATLAAALDAVSKSIVDAVMAGAPLSTDVLGVSLTTDVGILSLHPCILIAEDSFNGKIAAAENPTVVADLIHAEDAVRALTYGGDAATLESLIADARFDRLDVFVRNQSIAKSFACRSDVTVIPRRKDVCQKKRTLSELSEITPRSMTPHLCISAAGTCKFIGDCEWVSAHRSISRVLIDANAFAPHARHNELLAAGPPLGTAALFANGGDFSTIRTFNLDGLLRSHPLIRRFAIRALSRRITSSAKATALDFNLDDNDLQTLKRLAENDFVPVTPAMSDEEAHAALMTWRQKNPGVPVHEAAFAIVTFLSYESLVEIVDLNIGGGSPNYAVRFTFLTRFKRTRDYEKNVVLLPESSKDYVGRIAKLAFGGFGVTDSFVIQNRPGRAHVAVCDILPGRTTNEACRRAIACLNAFFGDTKPRVLIVCSDRLDSAGCAVRATPNRAVTVNAEDLSTIDVLIWATSVAVDDITITGASAVARIQSALPYGKLQPIPVVHTRLRPDGCTANIITAGFGPTDGMPAIHAFREAHWALAAGVASRIARAAGRKPMILQFDRIPAPWPVDHVVGIDGLFPSEPAAQAALMAFIRGDSVELPNAVRSGTLMFPRGTGTYLKEALVCAT